VEPPPPDHPLLAPDLREKNLLITPHSAWLSLESRQRLLQGLLSNLQNFIDGKPSNQVA
jgi:glycerate dehydrogenase